MDFNSAPKPQQPFNTAQNPTGKAGQPWSTHDRACTHCRERKIRCGREKPRCANCERDGVECGYYPPGKRVNHIKLLCNNVGSLEDRLTSIEEELSSLTALLKADAAAQRLLIRSSVKGGEADETDILSSGPIPIENISLSTPKNRHIFRNQASHTDRYHGPCSLFALCKEISGLLLPERREHNSAPVKITQGVDGMPQTEAVEDVLGRLCLDAGIDEPYDSQVDYVAVRLPPKQILLMVILQFFEQADYATDIFVRSSFMRHMERVYSQQHTTPADEAWAICFNAIILLVLGSESSTQGSDPLVRTQLAQPFLFTVRTALGNSRLLIVPKLVNVQALALLSIAAQQYCSPGLASSIFAQACVLARIMGLHQPHITPDSPCPEEPEERFKVIRSLYLRDKGLLLSRGSVCWLPTFDCTLDPAVVQCAAGELNYRPRIQLAAIQEEVYRLFHSAESCRQPETKRKDDLARLEKCLERWANAHDIYAAGSLTHDADLKLQFFATRISAFRESLEGSHIRQALHDARASCLLLLMSYGKLEQSMISRFGDLPIFKNLSKPSSNAPNSRLSQGSISNGEELNDSRATDPGSVHSQGFHSLLETFSVPAFLLLVKNTLLPVSDSDEPQVEDDVHLLESVTACYQAVDARNQGETYVHKVGRIFSGLLHIVHLVRSRQQRQQSPNGARQTGGAMSNSPNLFDRQQCIPELVDLSGSSSFLTPSISQDGFSAKVPPSLGTPDMTTTSSSTNLLTSMESDFLSQWYEPLRQLPFSPLLQQSALSVPSRKRQRLGEPEFGFDDSDPTSLATF
ncbi:hypothetical protein VTO42DRAFT_2168 [Malbranchea cinnamomea]